MEINEYRRNSMQRVKRVTGGRIALIAAAAICASAIFASAARAETVVSQNGSPVTIADNTEANPYPAEAKLTGADGKITDVEVHVRLSHSSPDDVDIALVPPEGPARMLMSDACGGGDLVNADLVFDDDASATISNLGPCAAGTFEPGNYDGGDAEFFSPPGPDNVGLTDLADLVGGDPNGTWQLFVRDDGAVDTGSIASWSVHVTTERAEVVIPGTSTSGVADPYPSTKTFEAPPGEVIAGVEVRVPSFNHTFPDDVDMLLEGPDGRTTMLMSDACGGADIHGGNWAFGDEATAQLSDDNVGGCLGGYVRPSNFGPADESLPAPAPQSPYGSDLSVYDGLTGGQWRLYVHDDSNGDTGYIKDWSLELYTRQRAYVMNEGFLTEGVEGKTADVELKRSANTTLGPATLGIAVEHFEGEGEDVTAPSTIEFDRGQTTATVEVQITDDALEEPMERLLLEFTPLAGDAQRFGSSKHEIRIAPSDKPLPPNEFTFGKAKRLRWGGALVPVRFPGPGPVEATGPMIRTHLAKSFGDERTSLVLEPSKAARAEFKQGRKVKAGVDVTFTPYDGVAATKSITVVLRKKPKKR